MKVEFKVQNAECGVRNEQLGAGEAPMSQGQSPGSNVQRAQAKEMMGALAVVTSETEQSRQATGGAAVAEIAAGWLAPQYLVSLRGQVLSLPDGPERFELLQKATGNVVSLQLAGVWAGRLRVEQEKLELLRQKHKDLMELAKAAATAKQAEAEEKRLDPNRPMTDEELKACVDKVDEIMGLKPIKNAERGVRSAETFNSQHPKNAESGVRSPETPPHPSLLPQGGEGTVAGG